MNKGPNHNFQDIIKALKKVSLRDDEKNAVRENLISYIKSTDVRNPDEGRPSFRSQLLTLISLRNMPIVLSIMLLLGGGVTLAAENSLPGELFYPVKGVSEKARVTFALSEETKAEFESKFASRRLEEAEKLMVKGELSAEERADLETRFEAHAERVNKHIEKLREKKSFEVAAEISSELESSLMAHSRVLARLSGDVDAGDEKGDLISAKVQLKGDAFGDLRRGLQMEITAGVNADMEVSVGQKLQSVMHKIGEVRDFIESKADKVSAEIKAEAEAKVKIADEKVVEAKAKIEARLFKEAFAELQEAQRIAGEAKLLVAVSSKHDEELNSSLKINADLDHNLDVNTDLKLDGEVEKKGIKIDSKVDGRVNIGL